MQNRESRVFPRQDSFAYSHQPEIGFSLFLERRCKRIYFIRHAEGFHNVAERDAALSGKSYDPPSAILLEENTGRKYWDARLTPKGEQQCSDLQKQIDARDHALDLELVVVSPLTRTLQTAFLSLGPADAEGAPPYLASEMCRERVAEFTCDGRRNLSEIKPEFPGVDWSLVESDEDTGWHQKEDDAACRERAVRFLEWLAARPETRIGVVTHSIFLKNLFHQFGFNVDEHDRNELRAFPKNAEMRGVMLCAHKPFAEEDGQQEA